MTKTNALPPLPGGDPPTNVVQMPSKKKSGRTGVSDDPKEDADNRKAAEKGRYKRPVVEVDPMEVEEVEKKLNKLSSGAVEALKDMDHTELDEHLITLTTHAVTVKRELATNEKIQAAKAEVSEMQAPYKETLRGIDLRQRLTVLYRAQRSGPVKK